jgi:homoserine kinase
MRAEPLSVRVPCSTSNLGPGFDQLGLALDLFLEVRVLGPARSGAHELEEALGEAVSWPAGSNAVLRALDAARGEGPALRLWASSEIPLERGLGSSGAAVAAGLLLGAALAEEPPAPLELLRLGIELEGHPDNVTASLRGGLTLCSASAPEACLDETVHHSLRFPVAWSEARLETTEARALLPRTVPHADAAENARRLPLLLAGLRTADPARIALGIEDRLHVPHRLPAIPGGAEALAAARDAGAFGATISGAGSALVAITDEPHAEPVAAAMARALGGTSRVLRPVLEAPSVKAPH